MLNRDRSASWYCVAPLKPRLRGHVRFHRHRYRGRTWFVLADASADRYHRFTPAAQRVACMLDGERALDEVWRLAAEELGADAPTQDELIQLVAQLHGAGAVVTEAVPDAAELYGRIARRKQAEAMGLWMSPLFWRIPLLDPDRFLVRTLPWVRPLFGRLGALAWLAVVGTGLFLAVQHWGELSADVVDRILTAQNVALLWAVFPTVKILHELGHAYACRHYGGEVHEIGVLLLVFMPLPYVDASSSSGFREKRQRMGVGLAGIAVELFLAGLAAIVYVTVEPGLVRAIAYNTMFIAGVSTLLFNGNPLLRYDGYYVLADLVEMPNLRQRAMGYLRYLLDRYVLRLPGVPPQDASASERAWFVAFGLASSLYRVTVMTGIVLLVASKFFFVGAALAVFCVVTWVLLPLARGLAALLVGRRLRPVRARALAIVGTAGAAALLATCVLPFPLNTVARGIVWLPEQRMVRVGADGFVAEVLAAEGQHVAPGDPLLALSDPWIEAEAARLGARIEELEVTGDAIRRSDRVRAAQVDEELVAARAELARVEERRAALTVRSGAAGVLVLPRAEELPGSWLARGTAIGEVLDEDETLLRVVLRQTQVDLVRRRTEGVEVRLAERPGADLRAEVRREVPAGSVELPATSLGAVGGGDIAIDPSDVRGVTALERHFQLELALAEPGAAAHMGGRARVRFRHPPEPLVRRWYRAARRLFLRRFDL